MDVKKEQTPFLKKAHDALAEPFERLLIEARPDLVIVDFAAYRISEVAAKHGVTTAFLSRHTGFPRPTGRAQGGEATPEHQAAGLDPFPDPYSPHEGVHRVDDARHARPRCLGRFQRPASGEGRGGKQLRVGEKLRGVRGEVLESNPRAVSEAGFTDWLASSGARTEQGRINRLNLQMAFIWILRKPQCVDGSDLLPPGFARVSSCLVGRLSKRYSPIQQSGDVFSTRAGEPALNLLLTGHPLILLPMVSDQGLTAKLLAENQVGYEVPRNEDGTFSRDVVAESIRRVLVEEEGEQLKAEGCRAAKCLWQS